VKLRRAEIAVIVLVVLSFVLGLYFHPMMPERVPSHWNVRGEVDGYMPRTWGVFLMPIVILGIAVLLLIIPRVDPLKRNIEEFRGRFEGFMIVLVLFMIAVELMILLWGVGIRISPNAVLPIGIGVLIFDAGILLEHAKRNWFIGIRTPWTLSSDEIWYRTHRLGGILFKVAGAVAFLGVFFGRRAVWFILIPILLAVVGATAYSYVEYRRLKKGGVQ
jgi:uncharacterized membrane protein